MAFCSEIAEVETRTHPLRRRHPRYPLRSLVYVKLAQGNGGIIRDLTESGIAIQVVAPLYANTELKLSFDLLSPRVHVETGGRVAWTDSSGQAGIQFSGHTLRIQRALRDWLLTQMLCAAAISGRDSIFQSYEPQLTLSAAARPAIVIDEPGNQAKSPLVSWGFLQFSARTFSIFIDTLILLCAILLFSISTLAIMGGIPAWPLAAALFTTSFLIFVAAYHLLFSGWLCGATPGQRLATLASIDVLKEEPMQRFR
jgi:PilZ domain/RDD family